MLHILVTYVTLVSYVMYCFYWFCSTNIPQYIPPPQTIPSLSSFLGSVHQKILPLSQPIPSIQGSVSRSIHPFIPSCLPLAYSTSFHTPSTSFISHIPSLIPSSHPSFIPSSLLIHSSRDWSINPSIYTPSLPPILPTNPISPLLLSSHPSFILLSIPHLHPTLTVVLWDPV